MRGEVVDVRRLIVALPSQQNKVSNPLQDLVGVLQQQKGKSSSKDLVERQLALIEAEKRQRCGVHDCDVSCTQRRS